MPATVSATVLGTFKSIAANIACTHSPGSAEVITVAHGLGRTPHFSIPALRSVVVYGGAPITGSATGYIPVMSFRSANASQAIFDGSAPPCIVSSNWQGNFDFYFEFTHAIAQ